MIDLSSGGHQSAFSPWLRTGWPPRLRSPDGLELKFNPWHDPADGRFTSVGAGRNHGSGEDRVSSVGDLAAAGSGRLPRIVERSKSGLVTEPLKEEFSTARGERSVLRRSVKVQAKHDRGSQSDDRPNPVAEFVGGVGRGLHGLAAETIGGVRETLTTNPVTTLRNAGREVARIIDQAIVAEDAPARVHMARAASKVANCTIIK